MEEEQQDIPHALQIDMWLVGSCRCLGASHIIRVAVRVSLAAAGRSVRVKGPFTEQYSTFICCQSGHVSRACMM